MVNWTHVGALILSLVGGLLLGIGVFGGIDAWATMSQIEAQGVLGQAAYQEEYQSAVFQLQMFGLAVAMGFVFTIGGSIEYLRGTIEELAE